MSRKLVDPAVHLARALQRNESAAQGGDALAIDAMDHIEIYSSNAKQAAYYFINAFGFTPVAFRGPQTEYRDSMSYVLKQNDIYFVISGASNSPHPIASEVEKHGFTVKNLALRVPDCQAFYYEALMRGAESVEAPHEWSDEHGSVRRAAIKTYGNANHLLIERQNYKGLFWPGFVPFNQVFSFEVPDRSTGLLQIDHIVGNVESMDQWVTFYEKVLGFKEMIHFTNDDISTEYSALMSKVMNDGSGKIKFPINEPAEGKRKSQIEEFLEFHRGAGVQHVAMRTENIIETVSKLRAQGVEFLRVPSTYYDELPDRIGDIKQDLQRIAELGILVDRDEEGYLLQLFTRPVSDRPTLFFEIIQREGSQGFGKGNFKALFEALEREQEARGNL